MPTSSKLRPLLLGGTALLFSAHCLAAAPNSADRLSWFDLQLNAKRASLLATIHKTERRDVVVNVGALDEIFELRRTVSDPHRVDALLADVANDSACPEDIRAEAAYLRDQVTMPTKGEDPTAKILVSWAADNGNPNDVELKNATVAIGFRHHLRDASSAEQAAEISQTAGAWYAAATVANDQYHRSQALRRVLDLDRDFVPAEEQMAQQLLAQGRVTRARSLLTAGVQRRPGEPSLLISLAEIEINEGHGSAALAQMTQLDAGSVSISVMRRLANAYAQLGLLNQARELAHRALAFAPGGLEERELALRLDQQAADPASITHDVQEQVAKAESSSDLDSSREDDVQAERLRRILHGEIAEQTHDSQFFENASELIRAWHSLPPGKRTESRLLADVRVDQLRPDYQSVQHVQQLIAIGSAVDVPTYKTRSIQYSPDTQELNIVRARIHRADGRSGEAEDLGESSVVDPSVAMYYDSRVRQLRFRDLRAGDVIELEYEIAPTTNANPYGHYFAELIAFGSNLPCNLQRYVLRSPAGIHLNSAEQLVAAPEVRSLHGTEIHIWQKSEIPALIREPRSPSWSEQGAYVHVSNFDSWEALGKWYRDLVQPQFQLNPELERAVATIVEQHPNRLDRVAAIDEFVLNSTRYVALEFGVYGFKPYPVTQTFARGFGDCKDKASLMIALLRGAGIGAEIALVRTQHLGDIASEPASASIFDHAIVYVPEFDLWLDGTAEFARLRELPVEDQGVMALTVDADGNSRLRRTPQSAPGDNYSRRTINARIDVDGTIRFSGATYVRGEDAPELRRQLEPSNAKVGYVRDRLAQVLPAVEVRDVELPQNGPGVVSLNFTGDLTTFSGRRIASLPSSWMERNYVATLSPSTSRTQDLVLDAPWTTEEELHIQLPAGARVSELPKDWTVSTEFGEAVLKYWLDGQELTVLSKVEFLGTRVAASRYAAFRDFTTSIEEAFHHDIQVLLP